MGGGTPSGHRERVIRVVYARDGERPRANLQHAYERAIRVVCARDGRADPERYMRAMETPPCGIHEK